jgi:hypothetical protein
MEIVTRADELRRWAVTPQQWAEVRRFEKMAAEAYELEALGARILSAVMRTGAPSSAEPAPASQHGLSLRLSAIRRASQRLEAQAAEEAR